MRHRTITKSFNIEAKLPYITWKVSKQKALAIQNLYTMSPHMMQDKASTHNDVRISFGYLNII